MFRFILSMLIFVFLVLFWVKLIKEFFDCNIFGFAKSDMEFTFFQYRTDYMTKDDILDKILKHGKKSLTQNDLLFLEDKEMIFPINQQKLLSL